MIVDEDGAEHEPERELGQVVVAEDQVGDREEQAEAELGERVTRRDPLTAGTAAAAQHQPRDHRHVVAGGDLGTAGRTPRATGDELLTARNAVGDHGDEAADEHAGGEQEQGWDHRGSSSAAVGGLGAGIRKARTNASTSSSPSP